MALDAAANFAKAALSTGYTSGATSIVLVSGGGAKFPAVPFNAIWYDSTTYSDPADDPNVEIVRVTAISTDTLTVTRAQESTSAAAHNTAGKTYTLVAGPTAKLITDIAGLTRIAQIVCAGSQATVDFTSIPAGFTDLEVVYQARSNVSAATDNMSLKFNNDATSGNYTITQYTIALNTAATVGNVAASAAGLIASSITAGTGVANGTGDGRVVIGNYAGTTFYKHMAGTGVYAAASGAGQEIIISTSGTWKSTAAVTRLTFSNGSTFVNGSIFTLYGIG